MKQHHRFHHQDSLYPEGTTSFCHMGQSKFGQMVPSRIASGLCHISPKPKPACSPSSTTGPAQFYVPGSSIFLDWLIWLGYLFFSWCPWKQPLTSKTKYVKLANIGAREMKFGLFDGGNDDKDTNVGFVMIQNICDTACSFLWNRII